MLRATITSLHSLHFAKASLKFIQRYFNFTSISTMAVIHIDPSNIAAAEKTFSKDTPIFMLNMLRFHPEASYPSSHASQPATSGQEAWAKRYIPAFRSVSNKVLEGTGEDAERIFFGMPAVGIVTPEEIEGKEGRDYWHAVALVRYPCLEVFRKITESREYEETALPHRLAGLEDFRLLAISEVEP